MSLSIPFLTPTRRCALCKEVRKPSELFPLDGHLLCAGCLRLVRDEGITLPEKLASKE